MTNVYIDAAGLALVAAGVIWSNEVTKRMAKVVRLPFEVGCHSSTADRQARAVLRKYWTKGGSKRLLISFVAGYVLVGLGITVALVFSK